MRILATILLCIIGLFLLAPVPYIMMFAITRMLAAIACILIALYLLSGHTPRA